MWTSPLCLLALAALCYGEQTQDLKKEESKRYLLPAHLREGKRMIVSPRYMRYLEEMVRRQPEGKDKRMLPSYLHEAMKKRMLPSYLHEAMQKKMLPSYLHEAMQKKMLPSYLHEAMSKKMLPSYLHEAMEKKMLPSYLHEAMEKKMMMMPPSYLVHEVQGTDKRILPSYFHEVVGQAKRMLPSYVHNELGEQPKTEHKRSKRSFLPAYVRKLMYEASQHHLEEPKDKKNIITPSYVEAIINQQGEGKRSSIKPRWLHQMERGTLKNPWWEFYRSML